MVLIYGEKIVYSGKNKSKTKTSDLNSFTFERLQKIKVSWICKNLGELFELDRVVENTRYIDVQK